MEEMVQTRGLCRMLNEMNALIGPVRVSRSIPTPSAAITTWAQGIGSFASLINRPSGVGQAVQVIVEESFVHDPDDRSIVKGGLRGNMFKRKWSLITADVTGTESTAFSH